MELSWKQEISFRRKSDGKGVLVQLAFYIHGRYLLKTWRNGLKTCHVYWHDLMSRRNCKSLRNCVLILFLGCPWCSQVRMFCLLIFSTDKFNIREYFCAENQTYISSHNRRVKVGNFADLQLLFFVFLHEIFASQLTGQRISIFHFHQAIMKRRSYFTSLTFGERLKRTLLFFNISQELTITKSGVRLNPLLCISGVYLLCSRYSTAVRTC